MAEDINKNSIFTRAFDYIKENLVVGYSLVLLLLVPAAFFADSNLVNINYGKAIDSITRKNAVLVENILNNFIHGKISDKAALQALVSQVKRDDDQIISLEVFVPSDEEGAYDILAASDPAQIGQKKPEDAQIFLARNNPQGVALIDEDANGRFWKVVKKVRGAEGEKNIGFMELSLSLADADATMNAVINYSYWVLALIMLGLVLLLANQVRLLGYALNLSKLKEVDKMKDMFISMASHELRSPLTAIKGYLELLQEDKGTVFSGEGARYFNNISISSKRLERLVEDVLEVSRIEGGRFPLEISVFDPYPLIKESVEEMRSQAIQKNLELVYEAPAAPVKISADSNRVKQVAVNLIGNALKYTQKGSIKVLTAVKKDKFLITVADTGIGISSEDQANLFQKFYRAKNEQTKDIIGTGLGLWITMETVKRMKGKITVESIEGVGSRFTVHLPLAKE